MKTKRICEIFGCVTFIVTLVSLAVFSYTGEAVYTFSLFLPMFLLEAGSFLVSELNIMWGYFAGAVLSLAFSLFFFLTALLYRKKAFAPYVFFLLILADLLFLFFPAMRDFSSRGFGLFYHVLLAIISFLPLKRAGRVAEIVYGSAGK